MEPIADNQPNRGGGGHRCTKAETEERINLVVDLLALGYHKHQIMATIAGRYGISTKSVPRYLHRARAILQESAGADLMELRGRALQTYCKVLRAGDATHSDRIRAQAQIDKLLGLNAPEKFEHYGVDPIDEALRENPDLVRELEDERRRIFEAADENDATGSNGVRVQGSRGVEGNGSEPPASS